MPVRLYQQGDADYAERRFAPSQKDAETSSVI